MSQQQRGKRTAMTRQGDDISLTHEEAESYSPYPPPDLVKAFEEIQEGMADRLMRIVEEEQRMTHEVTRHQMQENTKINDANIINQQHNAKLFVYGMISSFVLGLVILGVAVFAIAHNQPWVAGSAFTALGVILVILVLRQTPKSEKSQT
jgi:uncharacterized membrane protein